jgi:hypothetical protein
MGCRIAAYDLFMDVVLLYDKVLACKVDGLKCILIIGLLMTEKQLSLHLTYTHAYASLDLCNFVSTAVLRVAYC